LYKFLKVAFDNDFTFKYITHKKTIMYAKQLCYVVIFFLEIKKIYNVQMGNLSNFIGYFAILRS